MFKLLDKDGDGTLTTVELNNGYDDLGVAPPASLMELLKKLDADDSGNIDYHEFLKGGEEWAKLDMQRELNAATKKYEKGLNGKISLSELKSTVPDIEGTDWYTWINEADVNGDEYITLDELKFFLSKKLRISL